MHALATIHSYHAHVYYDPALTRGAAELLRQRIAERFVVQLGRWHDVPVCGPWLMLNRNGLDVLLHPNTLAPLDDHLVHALWLGEKLALKEAVLPVRIDADQESPIEPNTTPTLSP